MNFSKILAIGATSLVSLGILATSASAASVPAKVNDYSHVQLFGVYGNTQVGDCTLAAAMDIEQIWAHKSNPLSSKGLMNLYYQLSPQNNGIYTSQALTAWETSGILGVKIASANPVAMNQSATESALQHGPLYAEINLPIAANGFVGVYTSAQEPVGYHVPTWELSTTQAASTELHDVAVVGYTSKVVYIVTWGTVQPVAWSWWETYVNGLYQPVR